MSRRLSLIVFLVITSLVTLVDQVTKYWAHDFLSDGFPYVVTSFLNLVVAYNHGAAFGMLSSQNGWQTMLFVGIAVIVLVYLVYHIWTEAHASRLVTTGYGFIAGGAIGNLIDRLQFGFVVDFIDFHFNGWHFWVFNLADAALTLGVILLIIATWIEARRGRSTGIQSP